MLDVPMCTVKEQRGGKEEQLHAHSDFSHETGRKSTRAKRSPRAEDKASADCWWGRSKEFGRVRTA